MKQRGRVGGRAPFWSRLLGVLIAFAIAAVMVFGGMKNLLGELSAAHQALADSQSELAVTQRQLAQTQSALDASQQDNAAAQDNLDRLHDKLVAKVHMLRHNEHALNVADSHIRDLYAQRDDLKRGLGEAARALAQSNQQLQASQSALRASEAELERRLSQPQISVITTSERVYRTSFSERFAASRVRLFAQGDGGMMFYDGQKMLREVETSTLYAERTRTIVTQTTPGRDVLECLNDGCGMVLAAQSSSMQMQAYSSQSQYASMESLTVMEDADRRRGRRPGWRR